MIVLAGALAAFVGIVLVVLVQAIIEDSTTTAADRVLRDRAAQVVVSTGGADGRPQVSPGSLGPGVVVYDETGARVAGAVPPALATPFEDLSQETRARYVESSAGDGYRLLSQPFGGSAGAARGVVVVAERLAPYEADEAQALWLSVAAVLTLVLVAVVLVAWASRRALAPVAEMARTADEWGAHDLGRRFDLGPPSNEIRLLAHTLDGLLARVQTAILDEQRLSAELAHELRTPLTALQATAELAAARTDVDAELREDLHDILAASREMSTAISVLLDIARGQGPTSSAAVPVLDVVEELVELHRSGGADVDVHLDVPRELMASASAAVVKRTLGPVVDNAMRHGRTVRVTATPTDRTLEVRISDDGAGVDDGPEEAIFLPGTSGVDGSGLGLPLARRVARSVGGDVVLERAAGPTVFVVTLPGAPREPVRTG
jgi:signal transduction histidine kinase